MLIIPYRRKEGAVHGLTKYFQATNPKTFPKN